MGVPEDEYLDDQQLVSVLNRDTIAPNNNKNNDNNNKIQQLMQMSNKQARLNLTRQSLLRDNKKNSSLKTIFSVSNTMIGSSIMILPLVYQNGGLFTSILTMLIIGAIAMKTCLLEIQHFRPNETDLQDALKRVLSPRWEILYISTTVLFLSAGGTCYFLLAANTLYSFLQYVFNNRFPPSDKIVFNEFSFQYTGVILVLLCFSQFVQKKLNLILKVGRVGFLLIFIFIVYLIVLGAIQLKEGEVHATGREEDLTLFSSFGNIGTLCGVFTSSYFIHSMVLPIMRNNEHYENNTRDLCLGFLCTTFIYGTIGIFGYISIAGVAGRIPNPKIVFDYYAPSVCNCVFELMLFIQLITVLPVLWYIARTQLLTLIYTLTNQAQQKRLPSSKHMFHILNVVFSVLILVIQMLDANPTVVISTAGAVFGFVLIFLIPCVLHLKCMTLCKHVLRQTIMSEKDMLIDNADRGKSKSCNEININQNYLFEEGAEFGTNNGNVANGLLINQDQDFQNEEKELNTNFLNGNDINIKLNDAIKPNVKICDLCQLEKSHKNLLFSQKHMKVAFYIIIILLGFGVGILQIIKVFRN